MQSLGSAAIRYNVKCSLTAFKDLEKKRRWAVIAFNICISINTMQKTYFLFDRCFTCTTAASTMKEEDCQDITISQRSLNSA